MLGIIGAAAVIGIVETIAPHNGKTAGYMRLIAALCLLCVVIKPLGSAVTQIPELFEKMTDAAYEGSEERREYEDILTGEVEQIVRESVVGALKEQLRLQFGVENCEIGVSLAREGQGFRVEKAVVTLMGKDIFRDPYAIEAYVGDLLGCECATVIG